MATRWCSAERGSSSRWRAMAADAAVDGVSSVVEEPVAAPRGAVRPVRYCVASGTTIGLEPSRVANEDAHACLTGYLAVEEGPHAWAVLTVADGMGGMAAGEIASEEAVTAVAEAAAARLAGGACPSAREQAALVEEWAIAAH